MTSAADGVLEPVVDNAAGLRQRRLAALYVAGRVGVADDLPELLEMLGLKTYVGHETTRAYDQAPAPQVRRGVGAPATWPAGWQS